MQFHGEVGVDIVMQVGLTWMALRQQGHVHEPGMQNGAAKQESVGALGRMSGARGHLRALVSLMSGPEYLAPTRKMLIALNKASEHGEKRP